MFSNRFLIAFLVCGVIACAWSENLIQNWGFETGSFSPGWATGGDAGFAKLDSTIHVPSPLNYAGSHRGGGDKSGAGSGYFYQQVTVTPGTTYAVGAVGALGVSASGYAQMDLNWVDGLPGNPELTWGSLYQTAPGQINWTRLNNRITPTVSTIGLFCRMSSNTSSYQGYHTDAWRLAQAEGTWTYGTGGNSPVWADPVGRWQFTALGGGALSVDNAAEADAAIVEVTKAPSGAQLCIYDDRSLDDLGAYQGLDGQGVAIDLSFAPANASDTDLIVSYFRGAGVVSYQEGVALRAEGGDASNTTVYDQNTSGRTLLSGVDFTEVHSLAFVIVESASVDFYLDGVRVERLDTANFGAFNVNRIRFGNNGFQNAQGNTPFSGVVRVEQHMIYDELLPLILPEPSPTPASGLPPVWKDYD